MCFQHMNYLLPRLLPFKGAVNWRSYFVGIWKNKMLGKLFFYRENLCRGNEGWPCLGSVIDGKRKAEITWLSKNFQALERIARLERVLVYLFGFAFVCFLVPGFVCAGFFYYYYYFGGFLLFICCFLDVWSFRTHSVYACAFFFLLKLWDSEISFLSGTIGVF